MIVKSKMFGDLTVVKEQYATTGNLAIRLVDSEGMPVAMLTVNVGYCPLKEGEFLVKTWSENEQVAKDCLASGHFIDTGKRFHMDFVTAQKWRFASDGEET